MEYKKNDMLTVTIEDMGHDGEGIGKVDGYTVFVKDAVIGDTVQAKIMKAKKNYGYARLMEIITPSPDRVEPLCPYARQCGGCQIQALSYEKQLEYKENKIRNNLIRIGGFSADELPMEPIIGMENPFHYRNKAQFPVGVDKEGNIVTGFYAGRTHSIVNNRRCYLGVEVNEKILDIVVDYMEKYHVPAYEESSGKGLVRHVLIRYGFHSKEIMVCLVVNGNRLPASEHLVEELRKIPGMTSITMNVNRERTNVILGREVKLLWGQTYITDMIGNIKYQISPLSFYQVNPVQTEKLYGKALEFADLSGGETVWDLYCGIGTISLFLAQKAKQVYGVEIVPAAIEDARRNAALNGIKNAEFYVGKAEEVLPEKYEKQGIYADVIVVDPPRKGCEESVLHTMVKMQPKRIVYVSCDSATLARDLKWLCGNGYEIQRIVGCDMFSETVHVETVVLLSQQKPDDVIEVDLDLDELDITSAESKATYQEIKDYVLKEFGLKVSTLYISQIKRKCGIEVGEHYNFSQKENQRVPQCPKEKEDAIRAALEHFAMI
ncbi:MAG: 23S rRNA (uracil(1939)-C(5))-methyltransferase RlmD [Oliverpabstia sp.]|nr:23S rRNA (uracil(1939)-C(5))-methyltransferase RlmD [Lachnospiraceae bacterium]MDY5025153.1 23S rRNA (uracil(1939)-C(5))-methyltransferase RlmD [Oliverpabstia sp.]